MYNWGVWLVLSFIVLGLIGLVLLSVWGREQSQKALAKMASTAAAHHAAKEQAKKGTIAVVGEGDHAGAIIAAKKVTTTTTQREQQPQNHPLAKVATHGSTAHGVRTVPKPVGAPETDVAIKAGTGASSSSASGSAAAMAKLAARPAAPVSTSRKARPGRTRPDESRDQSFKKEWSKPDDKLLDLLASGKRTKTPIFVPPNPIRVSLEYPALAGSPGQFQRYPPNATNRPTVEPCELEGLYIDSSRYYGISSQTCAAVHPQELAAQNNVLTAV